MEYSQGKLVTGKQQDMNSLIMEQASETAGSLVQKDCINLKIEVYKKVDGVTMYTEDAQEIFNEHYDNAMEDLYTFANAVIIEHTK